MVEQEILKLEAQGANWIVCTCSSIGRLAEQSKTQFAQVIRVDRPMAITASRSDQIKVFAALSTTIEPTMALLAEYDQDIAHRVSVAVIPDAWAHYQNGDTHAYLATIAQYIEHHCQQDPCIVLAQASMAPSILQLGESLQHRTLTSPKLCLDYLLAELKSTTLSGK